MDVGRAPDHMPTPELAKLPNVIATPHVGGLTPQAIEYPVAGNRAPGRGDRQRRGPARRRQRRALDAAALDACSRQGGGSAPFVALVGASPYSLSTALNVPSFWITVKNTFSGTSIMCGRRSRCCR